MNVTGYISLASWAQWWKGEVTAVQRIGAGLLCLCAATSCLTISVLVVRRRGHHTGLGILREEQTMETQALLQPSVSFQMLASKDSATNPMLTSAMCVGSDRVIPKSNFKIKRIGPLLNFFPPPLVHENSTWVCFEINSWDSDSFAFSANWLICLEPS